MSLITTTLILIAGINIGVSMIILLRNFKSKINIYFFLTVLSIGLWTFSESMTRQSSTEMIGVFWGRTENFFGFLIAVFFLLFGIYFPYESFKPKLWIKLLYFFVIIFTIIVIVSPLYIYDAVPNPPNTDFVSLFWGRVFFTASFCFVLLTAFYILVKKYTASSGAIRKNLRSVLAATGIMGVLGTFFGVILPLFAGGNNPWYASAFSLPMVLILTRFMFKKT